MGLATVLAAGTAASCPARAAAGIELTYSVHLRGDVHADLERFAGMVAATLHDERGWSLGGAGIDFRRVRAGGDMRVILAAPKAVEAAAPVCGARWSCRVGREVLINELRWDTGTDSWSERSLRAYRHYVVNHEVGHFLGLGHRHCATAGGPAPVMQQQSISLEGCRTNVWPHLPELRQVAREQGVPIPRVSPPATDAARNAPEQARAAERVEAREAAAERSYGADANASARIPTWASREPAAKTAVEAGTATGGATGADPAASSGELLDPTALCAA